MNEECFVASAISTGIEMPGGDVLPDNIQWMPPGTHHVKPSVGGKATPMTVTVTPQMATEFNAQLQELRADAKAGVEDEPYIDFNHDDKERAGEVMELYWGGDDPKAGGIRARINWSAAGKAAVLGRNYRRFSPQWAFHKKTHEPIGVMTNLGGLVNRAAFTNIAPVIAKRASAATNNKTKMNEQEIQDAIAAGIARAFKPVNDRLAALESNTANNRSTAAAVAPTLDANAIGEAIAKGMKPLMDKFENAEKNALKAQASAAIRPHIDRGAIAPGDTETIGFWENAWLANAKNAEAQLTKLPGKKTTTRPLTVTTTRDADTTSAGANPEDSAGPEGDPLERIR